MKIVELENGLVDIEKISRLWVETSPICYETEEGLKPTIERFYMLIDGDKVRIDKTDYDKIYGILTKK